MRTTGLLMLGAGLGAGVVLSHLSPERTGEVAASRWLARRRRPALTRAALVIDRTFNPPWSVVVPTAASLAVAAGRGLPAGARAGALTTAGWYASHLAKSVFRRTRPNGTEALLDLAAPDSFPSGHTALCSALVTALACDAGPARGAALAVGVPLVVLTGASRVYLGVHYVADVLAAPLIAGGTVLALSSGCARGRR